MNGRTEIVSVDRLKKAHFECDVTDLDVVDTPNFNPFHSPLHTPTPLSSSPSTPDPPPQTEKLYRTKSGRTVHWPKKLSRTHFILFDLFIYFFVVCIACIIHFCAVRLLGSFLSFCTTDKIVEHHVFPTFVLVAELL